MQFVLASSAANMGASDSADHNMRGVTKKMLKGRKIPAIVLGIVVIYFIVGVTFYSIVLKWNIYTSLFYAVQTGLGVGYGNIVETESVHLFSIFYVLVGSALVSTSMAFFFSWMTTIKHDLLLALKIPTEVDFRDENGYVTIPDIMRFLWFKFKIYIGWYHKPARVLKLFALSCWIFLGTAFFNLYSGWTINDSLFASVTSCSTAGFMGPQCRDGLHNGTPYCILDPVEAIFVSFYLAIGIPIYVTALGEFGAIIIGYLWQIHAKHQMKLRTITIEEFFYIKNVVSDDMCQQSEQLESSSLNKSEYILLELLRLGKTSKSEIHRALEKFKTIDLDGTGDISLQELRHAGLILEHDATRSKRQSLRQGGRSIDSVLSSQTKSVESTDHIHPEEVSLELIIQQDSATV